MYIYMNELTKQVSTTDAGP